MYDCVENLYICKASCCKSVSFDVKCFKGSDIEKYYIARGFKIERKSRDFVTIVVPNNCIHLDKRDFCDLHESKKKPRLCERFNEKTAKSGNYRITEGCIYG